MADFSRALYDEVVEHNIFYANSTNALLELEENQFDVLVEIRDIIKDFKNEKVVRGTKKTDVDSGGASVKGMFNKIGDLFKVELMSVFKEFNKMFGDISGIKKAPTLEFTNFLRDFMNAITLDGKYDNPRELAQLYKTVAEGFAKIGETIMPMSKGLLVFGIAEKLKIPTKFIEFIQDLFSKDTLKDVDSKKAKQMGLALSAVGIGIFDFSLYMAMSLPLMIIAIPAAIIMIPFVTLLLGVMNLVSMRSKSIKRGAKALRNISLAFLIFAGSLALISLMGDIDYPKVLGVMGLFLAFTAVITVISMIAGKDMRNAAIAIGILSISLIAFGFALILFKDVEWETMAKAGASLMLLALVSLVLGFNKGGTIVAAFAILIMVGSLVVLAYTIQMYKDIEWETLGKAGAVLLAVAGVAILLSFFGALAIFGALGMLVMAGAMWVMTEAIIKYRDIEWEDIGKFAASMGAVAAVLLILGNPMALLGGIIVAGVALSIAYAIDTVVGAFVTVLDALADFKKMGWTDSDSKAIEGAFSAVISSVINPFKSSGDLAALKSIGKIIAGGAGTSMFVAISSVIDEMVGAMKQFKDSNITIDDGILMGKTLSGILNNIMGVVMKIGATTPLIGDSDFENGVDAIRGIGKIMSELAVGVKNMSNLKFIDPSTDLPVELGESIFVNAGLNMKSILDSIKKPLIEIGKGSNMLHDSDFKNGLDSIEGLGSIMSGLAQGVIDVSVMTFVDPKTGKKRTLTQKDYDNVGLNINALLCAIKTPMTIIGSKGFWRAKSEFQRGVDSLKGISGILSEFAKGVGDMAMGIFTDPNDPKKTINMRGKYKLVGESISDLITAITDSVIVIGKKGFWRSKSEFQRGMDSLASVSGVIGGLSTEINQVINTGLATNELSSEEFGTRVGHFVNMAGAISKLGEKQSDITKASSAIITMNNSAVNLFVEMNKTTIIKIEKTRLLFESLVKLDTYSAKVFEDKLEAVGDLIEKTNEISSNVKDFGKAIIPKASEETKQMVALLESMALKQDELAATMTNIDTTLKGVLKVDQE